MIWIGTVIFMFFLAWAVGGILSVQADEQGNKLGVAGFVGALFLYIVFFVIFTLYCSIKQVDAGHRGLVYEFGQIESVEGAGLALIPPWAGLKEANVQVQSFKIDDTCENGQEHCISAAASSTQNVYLTGTLNFSIANCVGTEDRRCAVDEKAVRDLYRDVGAKYIEKVIVPRFREVPKQITVKYAAEEMIPKRPQLAADIADAFNKSLSVDPRFAAIQVISFNVENISFDPDFDQRIKDKANAQQQLEVEKENLRVAEQQAKVKAQQAAGEAAATIERAKGDAESRRIAADAEAYANNTINLSLTPLLLQRLAINRITDKIQVALLPSDGSFLLDPSRLLQPQP